MKPWVVVALALGAVALSGTAAYFVGRAVEAENSAPTPIVARDGGRMLSQAFPDTAGAVQPLKQWQGKVLVINFWATWCAPCRDEMPEFAQLQTELADRGVQFVGIGIDAAERIAQFQRDDGVNYPLLVGNVTAIDLTRDYGNSMQALPFTVVLDRDGRVAATKLGRFAKADLDSLLRQLI